LLAMKYVEQVRVIQDPVAHRGLDQEMLVRAHAALVSLADPAAILLADPTGAEVMRVIWDGAALVIHVDQDRAGEDRKIEVREDQDQMDEDQDREIEDREDQADLGSMDHRLRRQSTQIGWSIMQWSSTKTRTVN
jgi:hypothetical protein